jgi:ATP-dependent Clp protease ATP-binding subunit ClpC
MYSRHRLSPRAARILELARGAAREHEQRYVGTEHLLLGIIREGTGTAAKILLDRGVTQLHVEAVINDLLNDRLDETWVLGRLPGTPHFRDVLATAAEKAKGTGNWQIRSVDLLYALLLERGSTGYRALRRLGISTDSIRQFLSPRAVES